MTILSELTKGTTVNITLEMRALERNQFLGNKGGQIQFGQLTPQTILVADDVEENRFIIQYYLSKCPYKLIFAENGQKAVEAFKENKVDLVLMDLAMPLLDGYKATEFIRTFERENHKSPVPIIACTAYTGRTDIERAYESGCTSFIGKPFSQLNLLEAIENQQSALKSPSKAAV
jgi:CheY-like chemotaxis protein